MKQIPIKFCIIDVVEEEEAEILVLGRITGLSVDREVAWRRGIRKQ